MIFDRTQHDALGWPLAFPDPPHPRPRPRLPSLFSPPLALSRNSGSRVKPGHRAFEDLKVI